MTQSDQTQKAEGQADQAQQEQKPLFNIGDRQYDTDAAIKKIQSADSHISTLENEKKQQETLMEQQQSRIQELEAELAKKGDLSSKLDQALSNLNQQTTTEATPPVDLDKLQQDMLQKSQQGTIQAIQQYEQQKVAQSNLSENIQVAQKVLGSDYEAKLREMGSEFGFNDAKIQEIASGSTEFFKRVFGLNKPVQESVAPQQNLSYAQKARDYSLNKSNKPDPTKAFDGHTRTSMMQERLNAKMKEKGL